MRRCCLCRASTGLLRGPSVVSEPVPLSSFSSPGCLWPCPELQWFTWNSERALRCFIRDAAPCRPPTPRTCLGRDKDPRLLHSRGIVPCPHYISRKMNSGVLCCIWSRWRCCRSGHYGCQNKREVFSWGRGPEFLNVGSYGFLASANKMVFWWKSLEKIWDCRGKRVLWWQVSCFWLPRISWKVCFRTLACIVLTEDAIFALYTCDGQFSLFTFLAVLLTCSAFRASLCFIHA